MNEACAEQAIYLYCLAPSDCEPENLGVGIDGVNPVSLDIFNGITAVTSSVPLDDFCGEGAEARMKDLKWVGPRACRHEEVVERVMADSPVLPARFGTLLSTRERVGDYLTCHRHAILKFLDQMRGRQEWSVKVLLDTGFARKQLLEKIMEGERENLASLPRGKRYIQEKKLKNSAGKALNLWLRETGETLRDVFSRGAEGLCERKPLSKNATGLDADMVFNWAVLLSGETAGKLPSLALEAEKHFREMDLQVQCSGPWPPYSFCPELGSGDS